ncbi:MAG: hypothetical protein M1839_002798 [Geoglossum umbratile]|nr:MAG: hypothetical protein M1839_002798 [Geoglossum umbratile]
MPNILRNIRHLVQNLQNRLIDQPQVKIYAPAHRLQRGLQGIQAAKQLLEAHCRDDDLPVRRRQRAHAALDVAVWVCAEGVGAQCWAGCALRAVAVEDERALQAQHRFGDPGFAGGAHATARCREFVAVVEPVSERVAAGSAVEARFEAVGVEAARVGFGVGAFVVRRAAARVVAALDRAVAGAEAGSGVAEVSGGVWGIIEGFNYDVPELAGGTALVGMTADTLAVWRAARDVYAALDIIRVYPPWTGQREAVHIKTCVGVSLTLRTEVVWI